jgi:hypothetical protein
MAVRKRCLCEGHVRVLQRRPSNLQVPLALRARAGFRLHRLPLRAIRALRELTFVYGPTSYGPVLAQVVENADVVSTMARYVLRVPPAFVLGLVKGVLERPRVVADIWPR